MITIRKAEYDVGKAKLKVEATSSRPGSVLTVVGYGTMTYDARKEKYKLEVKNLAQGPSTVTVVSSLGGSATRTVSRK